MLKELSKLAQQLQQLQASLMQFAQQIPNEFINPANMRNMPFNDMQSMMEQIARSSGRATSRAPCKWRGSCSTRWRKWRFAP